MKNKKKIRERPIDDKKPISIIKDLNKEKEKYIANYEKLSELESIEKDLYKMLEYYDKRKKIEIPKAKKISEKNDRNANSKNYCVNNNIIYNYENHSNINNNEYILNYKLSEYKRPNHNIIYSTEEKNKINSQKKEYEIKEADLMFLQIRANFMEPGELEKIIIDLENNVTKDKEEKIDEEKARSIIETKYSKYKNYADSIINHFKDRRKTLNNSLLRKNWKKKKIFKRRNEKIKIRKNTQNLQESLKKIIEAKTFCENNVLPILNNLFMKEKLNKNLLKINDYIFMTECDKIGNRKIPEIRLKNYNKEKEKIRNIVEKMNKKYNTNELSEEFNKIKNMRIINSNINSNINHNINHINTKNNNNININNDVKIEDSNNVDKDKIDDIKREESINSVNNIISNGEKNQNQKPNNNNNINNKIDNNNEISKIEHIFPPISLDMLKNSNSNDETGLEEKSNEYRIRIRVNRANNITIDRYIQLKEGEDLNPFHDSFNKIINNYKKYNNSEFYVNALEKKNFENLFNYYNINKVKDLQLDESDDDDSICFNDDLKEFSSSYKQFLQSKRSHT